MIPSIPLVSSTDPIIQYNPNGYDSFDEINPFSPKKPSLRRNFIPENSSLHSCFTSITPPKSSSSEYLLSERAKVNDKSSPFSIPEPSPQNFITPLKLVKPDPNVFSHSGYKSKRNRHTTTPSALRYRVRAKFSPISKRIPGDNNGLLSSQSVEEKFNILPAITPRTPTKKSNTKFVLMSEMGPSTSPIRQYGYDSCSDVQAFPFSEHDICSNHDFCDIPSSPKRLVFSKENSSQGNYSHSSSDEDVELSISPFKTKEHFFTDTIYDKLGSLEWMSPRLAFLNATYSSSTVPSDFSYTDINILEDYFLTQYYILELIGSGSFAEVYKVCRRNELSKISCIKKSKTPYSGNIDRAVKLEEVAALWSISNHKNCIQILSAWEQSGYLFIETEYCAKGSLLDMINDYSGLQFQEEEIWILLKQLSDALFHVHLKGYIHLDLKPENILVDIVESKYIFKISDFGLARRYQIENLFPNQLLSDDVTEGDKIYLAPEILSGLVLPAADIFSLGLITLELAANIELPSQGASWQLLRSNSPLNGIQMNGVSLSLQRLIEDMLELDPKLRPSLSSIRMRIADR